MGERLMLVVPLVAGLCASGCDASCTCNADDTDDGGGDADVDADVDADLDAQSDADTDGDGGEVLAFDYFVFERTAEGERGDPLEGVEIAVDTPAGRAVVETDAAGLARLEVARDAGWITFTIAREGYTIVTLYRATLEDLAFWLATDGHIETLLEALVEPAVPDVIDITVTAAGVPAGATWCVSAEPFAVTCGDALADASFVHERTESPVPIVGFVIDATGAFTEVEEIELADGLADQSAELVFDGVSEASASSIELTLELPADAQSVFRTQGVVTDLLLPVFVMEPATYLVRGGSTGHEVGADGASIDMTVSWFRPEGSDPLFGFALYPDDSYGSYAYRWFSTALESGVYDVIDIPRISSPAGEGTLGSTFAWQQIEGVDRYGLMIGGAGVEMVHWMVLTDHEVSVTLPDLPPGYDPAADWPADGAGGFRVFAWQDPFAVPDPSDPLRIDQQESASSWYALSLEW